MQQPQGGIREGKRRGLASMSPERRREIAQMGARALHQSGQARLWTREEAQQAGRKGGRNSRRGPSKNPCHTGETTPENETDPMTCAHETYRSSPRTVNADEKDCTAHA